MKEIHIDIETYCEASLKDCGVRKYVEDPSFEILLVSYAIEDGEVKQADLANGDRMPTELLTALLDPDYEKIAHNATFERTALSKWLHQHPGAYRRFDENGMMDPGEWHCTMVRAFSLGIPGSLEKAGEWLGIPADKKKMSEGKRLIQKYCVPGRNGKRHYPEPSIPGVPNDWDTFKLYNRQDVEAERAIMREEDRYPLPPMRERDLYRTDQRINDRGVGIDIQMAKSVNAFVAEHTERLLEQGRKASGLENPQSLKKAKQWLATKGINIISLSKGALDDLITESNDDDVISYLKARKELGKTSVTKYEAMERAAVWHQDQECYRLHGTLQFDGAIRTGRWAGRIVQVQNLPRNTLDQIAFARDLALQGDWDWLETCYGKPMDTLSQLIRTAFIPKPGCKFVVADYSQIECRVAAWITGEAYKVKAFAEGKDIYKETAAKIFGKKAEDITHDERARGKVAELAGAYGGGIGAYKRFGADKMGLTDNEIQALVDSWRNNNPEIVRFWRICEDAFKRAIRNPGSVQMITRGSHPITVFIHKDSLFMRLPSGRFIAYKGIRISDDGDGNEGIEYLDTMEGKNAFIYTRTYGGKIFENLIQSTARDCLGEVLIRLDEAGYKTVFHVHDECINEVPIDKAEEDERKIVDIMRLKGCAWCEGLPLDADSYICEFYKKD